MICNLTAESFYRFGRITGKGHEPIRANRHSISLSLGNSWTYRCDAPTWVANESGIAILSVSADGTAYRDFYLTRPVVLQDGIRFKLTAFRTVASVQIGAVLLPALEKTGAAGNSFVARPGIHLKRIYSLLYQELEAGFLQPGESHSNLELVYVDSGSVHCTVEGQDILLERGDMMLFGPNQWHMLYAQTDCAPTLVSLVFDADGLDTQTLIDRKFRNPRRAIPLLQQMLREQEQMEPGCEDMIFSLLTQLLILLLREEVPEQKTVPMPYHFQNENEIVRRAQQYVEQNVYGKLSVPVVAQGIDVSASYLTALFQKHLQITPAEYIRRIKLHKSKQLIREGKLNFTEIAQALQYSTIHHFSRQFKEKFGITPTEYARTVRQEV